MNPIHWFHLVIACSLFACRSEGVAALCGSRGGTQSGSLTGAGEVCCEVGEHHSACTVFTGGQRLRMETKNSKGVLDGPTEEYHSNGFVLSKKRYCDGNPCEVEISFDRWGQLVPDGDFPSKLCPDGQHRFTVGELHRCMFVCGSSALCPQGYSCNADPQTGKPQVRGIPASACMVTK
jgi:hypothetical protein